MSQSRDRSSSRTKSHKSSSGCNQGRIHGRSSTPYNNNKSNDHSSTGRACDPTCESAVDINSMEDQGNNGGNNNNAVVTLSYFTKGKKNLLHIRLNKILKKKLPIQTIKIYPNLD